MSQKRETVVTVLGLGTMGHGIVQAFASQGIRVRGFDESTSARAGLHGQVKKNLAEHVRFGLHPAEEVEPTLARISVHDSLEDACDTATFVVEAVREDLATKQALFAKVEPAVADDTILASNSSSFPISQSGANLRRPQRALVTHWFNPPHIVPTVEIVPSPATDEAVTQAVLELHRRIGKLAIVLRQELPGFLVNRVQVAVMREVWDLLERGVATAEDIDMALRGSMGFRMAALGPLRVHDFGGLDIQAALYRNVCPEIRSDTTLPAIVEQKIADGHYGFKTGKGFYDHPESEASEMIARRDSTFLALLKLLHLSTRD